MLEQNGIGQSVQYRALRTIAAYLLVFALTLAPSLSAGSGPRLVVLDFELRDLTPIPETPEEIERTAEVGPLLRSTFAETG